MYIRFSEIKDEFRKEVEKEMPEIKDTDITNSMLLKIGKLVFSTVAYALYNGKIVDLGFMIIFPLFIRKGRGKAIKRKERAIRRQMRIRSEKFPFVLD